MRLNIIIHIKIKILKKWINLDTRRNKTNRISSDILVVISTIFIIPIISSC